MFHRSAAALGVAALLCALPRPTYAAGNAVSCSTVVACIYGQNLSTAAATDIGLEGLSLHGYGLVGVTSATPASSANAVAGLYGKDQGQSHYDSGVLGLSLNGTGVKGTGLLGVAGYTSYTSGIGVFGEASGGFGAGGYDAANGIGLDGESASGTALYVQVDSAASTPSYLIQGVGPGGQFYFDPNGNEYLSGNLTLGSGTVVATATTTKGRDVATYGARTSSPTLEDFGEATLTAGAVHVALDPAFASTIDAGSYMVFITPEGSSNGLYTAARTATGFDVRENRGGRSRVAFDYRIVAKPLGSTAPRLPLFKRPTMLKHLNLRR